LARKNLVQTPFSLYTVAQQNERGKICRRESADFFPHRYTLFCCLAHLPALSGNEQEPAACRWANTTNATVHNPKSMRLEAKTLDNLRDQVRFKEMTEIMLRGL